MDGGASHGYTRWQTFLDTGMSKYGARRNNAMCRCDRPGLPLCNCTASMPQ